MNDWLVAWGLEGWKPALQVLVMPPLPLLLLALLAAWWAPRRPRLARGLGLAALLALWVVCTPMFGHHLLQWLTRPPPVLTPQAITGLVAAPHTAVVVLGAGRRALVLEYGGPDLAPLTVERLRYGSWLARQTRLPLLYSGGIGHGAAAGPTEAEAVRQALARDHGLPLRWAEDRSRDTNENAANSVALLQQAGIRRVVLVTHDFHQQRALAAFRRAISRSGRPMDLVPAPVGVRPLPTGELHDFLPGADGLQRSGWALHEWLGRLAGA